jgi:putative flippase GtrA
MTVVDVQARRGRLASQLARFVFVGTLCALVDSSCYWAFLQLDVWVHLAKALSFVAGTTAAFFLNRRFTFNAPNGGATQAGGFALLYTTTFFVNVGANALMLQLLPAFRWEYALAWVVAQGTATVINFVMLRTVVFKH